MSFFQEMFNAGSELCVAISSNFSRVEEQKRLLVQAAKLARDASAYQGIYVDVECANFVSQVYTCETEGQLLQLPQPAFIRAIAP